MPSPDQLKKLADFKRLEKQHKPVWAIILQILWTSPIRVAGDQDHFAILSSLAQGDGQRDATHIRHNDVSDQNVRQALICSFQDSLSFIESLDIVVVFSKVIAQ